MNVNNSSNPVLQKADSKNVKDKVLVGVSEESLQLSKKLVPVLLNLFMCHKRLQLYSRDHDKVSDVAAVAADGLQEVMLDRKIISLDLCDRHFLFDDIIIDHDNSRASEDLYNLLEPRGISRVNFSEGVTAADIIGLLDILSNAGKDEKRLQIDNYLKMQGVRCITLEEHIENQEDLSITEGEFEVRIITDARKLYLVAVDIAKEIQAQINASGSLDTWKVDYLINGILHHIKNGWYNLLAMTTIRHIDAFEYTHPVNVCIQSTYLGATLLDDTMRLQELARAAFLHDCALLTDEFAGELEDDLYCQHPLAGARLLDCDKQIEKLVVVCAYEHHLQYDRGGFPQLGAAQFNLFTSIIAVSDTFDRILAFNPEQNLQQAADDLAVFSGSILEPEALQAFVDLLGALPFGSIVKLTSGELGWVQPGLISNSDKVKILVCTDADGIILDSGKMISVPTGQLSDRMEDTDEISGLLFHLISEVKFPASILLTK